MGRRARSRASGGTATGSNRVRSFADSRLIGPNTPFVTVPPDVSDDVRSRAGAPRPGFGSVWVEVTVGDSTWRTSVFPDKEFGCFVLPIKAAARRAEKVVAEDAVHVALGPLDS